MLEEPGKPHESAVPDDEVFAREEALGRLGGDHGLLSATAQIFLEELPKMTSSIGEALADERAADLRREAHSLKGASANVGAVRVTEAALQLEQLAAAGDLSGAVQAYESLNLELNRLEPLLQKYVRQPETQ